MTCSGKLFILGEVGVSVTILTNVMFELHFTGTVKTCLCSFLTLCVFLRIQYFIFGLYELFNIHFEYKLYNYFLFVLLRGQ